MKGKKDTGKIVKQIAGLIRLRRINGLLQIKELFAKY
jgi:hypothetical protein